MPVTARNDIPFELYKANLQFALRTNKLLKECGQHWVNAFGHAAGEQVTATQEQIERVSQNADWHSLATIPGETLLGLMRANTGNEPSMVKTAVANQTRFLSGLQEAFSLWQHDSVKAMGDLDATNAFSTNMGDFFKLFYPTTP